MEVGRKIHSNAQEHRTEDMDTLRPAGERSHYSAARELSIMESNRV